MGQLTLSGQLQGGAPNGSDLNQGRMLDVIVLALRGGNTAKPFNAATGTIQRPVNSPSSFITLSGIGTGDTVTHADTLYFFAYSQVTLRLTTDDGAGGDVVAVLPCDGLYVMEFPSAKFLKLLEIEGSANVEYFASGSS
jgi:hypothetical protein